MPFTNRARLLFIGLFSGRVSIAADQTPSLALKPLWSCPMAMNTALGGSGLIAEIKR